jgi:hypothetical protein
MPSRGMIRLLLSAALLSAALDCARAADQIPADAQAYVDRRTGCNYWPSEPAVDKLRKAEIERHVRNLRCSTLDHDEAQMLARYKDQPDILKAIADAHDAMPD